MPEETLETDQEISGESTTSSKMFTFRDLVDEITVFERRSQEANKESWGRLLEVANSLASPTSAGNIELLADQTWSLYHLSIQGHMGVLNSDPLEIDFDPSPGVTVLHGANGAGKSSISDAIETVLLQDAGPIRTTTAGNSPIWEAIRVGRDFDSAEIRLSLISNARNKLHLTATIGRGGGKPSYISEFEGANQIRTPIKLREVWGDVLTNHCPIFAYAALERRVQLSKDLAKYFEDLLALGGCFTALEKEIDRRNSESDNDFQRWQTGKNDFFGQIRRIDGRRRSEGSQDLSDVDEPKITDNIDTWLTTYSLMENGELTQQVPATALEDLSTSARDVKQAITERNASSDTVRKQLLTSLKSLHEQADSLRSLEEICPVCLADDPHWFESLAKTISELEGLDAHDKEIKRTLTVFQKQVKELLIPIASAVVVEVSNTELREAHAQCLEYLEKFDLSITTEGMKPHPAVLSSVGSLVDWIDSPFGQEVVTIGINQTHVLRQWKIERSKAATSFAGIWRETQSEGSQSLIWKEAKKRVTYLRGELRKRNTHALEKRVNDQVRELLDDVDLGISELTVLDTKATMKLEDSTGNQLELGMLSAGQRNAILLAPLLASISDGPFGFLILDDPVHAFDAMRIDRLAGVISKLAKNRRVIVLTHDERLRSHLLASAERCETRLVTRAVSNGEVLVAESAQIWEQLLVDARIIFHMASETAQSNPIAGTKLSVTHAVRGLCRQSLDNALGDFITRNALVLGSNYLADGEELDATQTTRARLKKAQDIYLRIPRSSNPLEDARLMCETFLDKWNEASHGNESATIVEVDEISSAEAACSLLSKHVFR